MCFYTDYDWYARSSDSSEGPAKVRTRCDECGQVIHAGEWLYSYEAAEYESCLGCDPDAEYQREAKADGSCDHGEQFSYECCEKCYLLRKAVRVVEEHEGCVGQEAEPPLTELHEAVQDAGGWGGYGDKMLALGLHREYAMVPEPDPDDLVEAIIAAYPELHDEWDVDTGWDVGGEG